MPRCIPVCGLALVLVSCGNPSTAEKAAVFVVRDMLESVPAEVQSVQQRRIARQWQSPGRRAVPEGVLAASGLPAVDTPWRPADSLVLVLNLFEPRTLAGDSIEVVAEWLVFGPGETFWGTEYQYQLRCRSSCKLLNREGPGYLN